MSRAILADGNATPACQGFTQQQEVGTPFTSILIILATASPSRPWQRQFFSLRLQFLTFLIQTNQGMVRIIGSLVDSQYIFHFGNETRADFWKTPTLDRPGSQFVFFSNCQTQVSEICSAYPKATIRSARSWRVQRLRPSGGSEQANITSLASAS